MGYSYVFVGDGRVPEGALEAWLSESTEEVEFEWPEDWEMEGSCDVREVLEFLADDEVSEATWAGGVVRVRTLADKSGDAWLTYRGDLAIAFRLLARHGGQGTLTMVGFEDGPEEGIVVKAAADGTSSATALDEDEALKVRTQKGYREVEKLAERAFGGRSDEGDEDTD